MDIEQLTKAQTVLLTLLVSFVTSIATGIVTVSLMEQGVTPVTQTINRVVERTKEVIVTEPADPVIITEEKTVVVREADLIAAAVKQNAQSTAALYAVTLVDAVAATTTEALAEDAPAVEGEVVDQAASAVEAAEEVAEVLAQETTQTEQLTLLGRGVILAPGVFATDAPLVAEGERYKVMFNDGTSTYAGVTAFSGGVAVLALEETLGTPVTLADMSDVTRGKTVVALSGTGRTRIVTAVIADLVVTEAGIQAIEVDAISVSLGATLIDIDGNVLGLSTSSARERGTAWFVGNEALRAAVATQ